VEEGEEERGRCDGRQEAHLIQNDVQIRVPEAVPQKNKSAVQQKSTEQSGYRGSLVKIFVVVTLRDDHVVGFGEVSMNL
jgi:hypothetical protein